MRKRAILTTLALGIIIMAIILALVGAGDVVALLANLNPLFLALAVVIEAFSLVVMFLRWDAILRACCDPHTTKRCVGKVRAGCGAQHNQRLCWGYSWKKLFPISLVGFAANGLTPTSRSGGEPVRILLANENCNIPIAAATASVVVERVADMLAFCVLTVITIVFALWVLRTDIHIVWMLFASLVITVLMMSVLVYFSAFNKVSPRLVSGLMKIMPRQLASFDVKLERGISDYYKDIRRICSNRRAMLNGFLYSLLYWLIEIVRAYVVFLALGAGKVSGTVIATAYIVSSITGSVPLLPGNTGVVEATMVLIYTSVGMKASLAGTAAVIDRIISNWLVILISLPVAGYVGLLSLIEKKRRRK